MVMGPGAGAAEGIAAFPGLGLGSRKNEVPRPFGATDQQCGKL